MMYFQFSPSFEALLHEYIAYKDLVQRFCLPHGKRYTQLSSCTLPRPMTVVGLKTAKQIVACYFKLQKQNSNWSFFVTIKNYLSTFEQVLVLNLCIHGTKLAWFSYGSRLLTKAFCKALSKFITLATILHSTSVKCTPIGWNRQWMQWCQEQEVELGIAEGEKSEFRWATSDHIENNAPFKKPGRGRCAWGGDLAFFKNLLWSSLPTGKPFQSKYAQKFPDPVRRIVESYPLGSI